MLGGVVNNNSNKETTMTSKSQQATATKIRLKRVANTDGSSSYKFFSPLDGLRFCNVVRRQTEGWTIQWVRTPSETSWARTLPKARRIIGAALAYRDHPGHGPNGAPQGALPTIPAKSVTVASFTSRGTYNCASCGLCDLRARRRGLVD